MDFSNIKTAVLVRVGSLLLSIIFFDYLISNDGFELSILVMIGLIGFQIYSMIKYLNNAKNDIDYDEIISQIRTRKSNLKLPTNTKNEKANQLNYAINYLIDRASKPSTEKEEEFQYLKNIVQHIGIGIITFDKTGKVQILNSAAKKLLKLEQLDNINELSSLSKVLVESITRLRTGGRDLVRVDVSGDIVQLAIFTIELTLRGDVYKLVSLQNIQNELEEKEMEAWQNLVRVLTHEIMNSVTPISSLANTVDDELKEQLNNDQEVNQITNEEIEDLHLAVQTIRKRSEGLIKFVQDFRNLTQVGNPNLSTVSVAELIDDQLVLLKKDIESNGITISKSIVPSDLKIRIDRHMIDQVLINLIKNATQAFDEQTSKQIDIKAFIDEKDRPIITIKDNGNGIDEEAVEKIFIPFFTTKKNGSGIGLSLSRQIMRKHQGTLSVKSKVDEGTEFFLRF